MDDIKPLLQEAQRPETSPARLAELATHESSDVRRAVARNGALPEASLAALLADAQWDVQIVAAHHKRAPKATAQALVAEAARSTDNFRRSLAARSPLTDPEDLARLTKDADGEVRSNACKNPRTAPAVARGGLTDSEPCVVLGALAHPAVTNDERRAFCSEEFLLNFLTAHADGDHLFEALCERYLWDVLERAFLDPEKFDDVWQELVRNYFELIEIPSRNTVLAAVHREHWPAMARRLAQEVRGVDPRRPD